MIISLDGIFISCMPSSAGLFSDTFFPLFRNRVEFECTNTRKCHFGLFFVCTGMVYIAVQHIQGNRAKVYLFFFLLHGHLKTVYKCITYKYLLMPDPSSLSSLSVT